VFVPEPLFGSMITTSVELEVLKATYKVSSLERTKSLEREETVSVVVLNASLFIWKH
jgi:hypothetical protein